MIFLLYTPVQDIKIEDTSRCVVYRQVVHGTSSVKKGGAKAADYDAVIELEAHERVASERETSTRQKRCNSLSCPRLL